MLEYSKKSLSKDNVNIEYYQPGNRFILHDNETIFLKNEKILHDDLKIDTFINRVYMNEILPNFKNIKDNQYRTLENLDEFEKFIRHDITFNKEFQSLLMGNGILDNFFGRVNGNGEDEEILYLPNYIFPLETSNGDIILKIKGRNRNNIFIAGKMVLFKNSELMYNDMKIYSLPLKSYIRKYI